MAGEIIIRKAKKDYVCSCCGHKIKQGEEYLDKVIINTGKIVRHDRYHDECPASTDVEKLIRKIEAAEGDLIAMDANGDKWHIIGVQYEPDRPIAGVQYPAGVPKVPMVIVKSWATERTNITSFDAIKTLLNENGDRII